MKAIFFFVLLVFLCGKAFAARCPELEGEFLCVGESGELEGAVITHDQSESAMRKLVVQMGDKPARIYPLNGKLTVANGIVLEASCPRDGVLEVRARNSALPS